MTTVVKSAQKHQVENTHQKQHAVKRICNYADNYYGDQTCKQIAQTK